VIDASIVLKNVLSRRKVKLHLVKDSLLHSLTGSLLDGFPLHLE
jgi:hypothetical protein